MKERLLPLGILDPALLNLNQVNHTRSYHTDSEEVHVVSVPTAASSPPASSVSTPVCWRKLNVERLSYDDETYVNDALHTVDQGQIALRMASHVDLTFGDFRCLQPLKWLNDEVINATMLMLQHVSKDTMVLSTFTKETFLMEYKSSQLDSRRKLGRTLSKHMKKHQVRSTTGLCHTFLIILFSVKCARAAKGACALEHGRSPLGTVGHPTGPECFRTNVHCCKVRNACIDINAHSTYLHEPFL